MHVSTILRVDTCSKRKLSTGFPPTVQPKRRQSDEQYKNLETGATVGGREVGTQYAKQQKFDALLVRDTQSTK